MAFVLLWAALEKARHLPQVASTMAQLGMRAGSARRAAALLVSIEAAVALGLVFRPGSSATITGVVALAAAFAISGVIALRQDHAIQCRCFGPYDDGRLGLRQVASFPLWIGGAALLWLGGPRPPSDAPAASLLVAVALTMAALRAVEAVKQAHVARGDRRSSQEMHPWLSR